MYLVPNLPPITDIPIDYVDEDYAMEIINDLPARKPGSQDPKFQFATIFRRNDGVEGYWMLFGRKESRLHPGNEFVMLTMEAPTIEEAVRLAKKKVKKLNSYITFCNGEEPFEWYKFKEFKDKHWILAPELAYKGYQPKFDYNFKIKTLEGNITYARLDKDEVIF